MSGHWYTYVYFTQQQPFDREFIYQLLRSFTNMGCTFFNPNFESSSGFCITLDGLESVQPTSLEAAVQWLLAQQGGGLQIWFALANQHQVDFLLTFDPQPHHPDSNLYRMTLGMDYAYFRDEAVIEELLLNIFRWSTHLATYTNATIGMGDLDPSDSYFALTLNTDAALVQGPRLKWWNYFGNAQLEQWGENTFNSYSLWARFKTSNGLVIISAPPHPSRATTRQIHFIAG